MIPAALQKLLAKYTGDDAFEDGQRTPRALPAR